MRVLMVSTRFLPHLGGTEIHTYELARRLRSASIDVTILTTELERAGLGRGSLDGLPVRRVPAWPRRRDWYIAPGLVPVIRRGAWDLVHVQGIHTMVLPITLAAARTAGVPYVITLHSGGQSLKLREQSRELVWNAVRGWIRRAKAIIAVSEFERDVFAPRLGIPPESIAVIPSGVEPPAAPAGKAVGGSEARSSLILSLGRLEPYKGHDRVIRALPRVTAEIPDVRLVVLGNGPDEARLRCIAAEVGLADRLEIVSLPYCKRAQLSILLQQAALVVALSAYESQGLGAMEAAAHGCSVLVADSSALHELVGAGLARGVNRESTNEVAAAMIEQLRNPHRPVGTLPTWDACTERILATYGAAGRQRFSDSV